MEQNFKIGDKVWGAIGVFGEKYTYATIVDFDVSERYIKGYDGSTICIRKDVTVQQPDGTLYQTKLSDIYKCDERHLEIHGKSKWDVNRLLEGEPYKVKLDNGYFGSFSLIQYKGKQCIVYVDDRNAKVIVKTEFYDKIYYKGGWSGDYRWNSDKPVVVYDKELGYNIIAPHSNKLLCKEWLLNIDPTWLCRKDIGYYLIGADKNRNAVRITSKGSVRSFKDSEPSVIQDTLERVKHFSEAQILTEWILKGKPCAHIRGLEYKGACAGRVTQQRAEELFKTHKSFDLPFESVQWKVLDGEVCLLFRDYADSDYD